MNPEASRTCLSTVQSDTFSCEDVMIHSEVTKTHSKTHSLVSNRALVRGANTSELNLWFCLPTEFYFRLELGSEDL